MTWTGCAVLCWAPPAAACIAQAQTYTLDGAYPAPDASDVPTNAPLVLRLVQPAPGMLGGLPQTSTPLSDATTHEVVQSIVTMIGPRPKQVFAVIPVQPLQPHTTYVVDLGTPPPAADSAGAPPTATWQFTTGDIPAAALRLKGDLSVSYEAGTDPHYDCSSVPSLCGACPIDKQVNVTKARVALPASFDGFSTLGVEATLRVYEPLPDGKSGAWSEIQPSITAGEVGEALVTMPLRDDGSAYAPCFEFEVMDASGVRTSQLTCLDVAFPLPEGAPTGAAGAATGAAGAGSDVASNDSGGDDGKGSGQVTHRHTSTACSFAPPERGVSTSSWVLSALLLAGWLRSGRRPRRLVGRTPAPATSWNAGR